MRLSLRSQYSEMMTSSVIYNILADFVLFRLASLPSQPDVPRAMKRSGVLTNMESRPAENPFVRIAGRLPASRWRALLRHARNCGAGNGRNALLMTAYGLVLAHFSRSRRFLITLMLSSVDRRARGLQRLFGNLSTTMLLDMDMDVPKKADNGVGFARMAQDVSRRLLQHLPHGALFSGLDVAQELHRRSKRRVVYVSYYYCCVM